MRGQFDDVTDNVVSESVQHRRGIAWSVGGKLENWRYHCPLANVTNVTMIYGYIIRKWSNSWLQYRCTRKIDKTTWIRLGVRQILSIFLEYQVRILTVWNRVDQKIPGGTHRKIDENCLSFCTGWYSGVRSTEKIHYCFLVTLYSRYGEFLWPIHDLLNQHSPLTGIIALS